MEKPVVGDIVVLPFPHTDLQVGKRRPAVVVADLPGDDLILCQITSQSHRDLSAVTITHNDFETGRLTLESFARPGRLFTVDRRIVVYVTAHLRRAKTNEILSKIRSLFAE